MLLLIDYYLICSQSTIQRHKDTLAKNRAELLQWPGLTSGVYYSGNLIF